MKHLTALSSLLLALSCEAGGLLVAEPVDAGTGGAGGSVVTVDAAQDAPDARDIPPPDDAAPTCLFCQDGGDQ